MEPELAERLKVLESHLAQLEHQHDQLNQVVVEQADAIRRLQQLGQKLAASVESTELQRIKENNQKPPHYQ